MIKLLTEQKVLKKLNIEDFRDLTKVKLITMASMLDKIDPEVAKRGLGLVAFGLVVAGLSFALGWGNINIEVSDAEDRI